MIEIIPAIDLIDGQCVRLTKGDYDQVTVYESDPLLMAQRFEDAGMNRLHLVDLDGARCGRLVNISVLQRIANGTTLSIDYSGGIKATKDAQAVFSTGAAMIGVGSVAVNKPELLKEWIVQFGPDRILLGADVKNDFIAINGWQHSTDIRLLDFLETQIEAGVRRVFCTDIAKDGMMQGPAVSLYHRIMQRFPQLELIASGGVRTMDDVVALEAAGCAGVIIGKAIYEGSISLKDLGKKAAA